jgi:large subunit ribosomal protein L29
MKTKDLKEMTLPEMRKKLRETRDELLQLRLRKQTGQVERPHMLKTLRRDIARLETLIRAKETAPAAA